MAQASARRMRLRAFPFIRARAQKRIAGYAHLLSHPAYERLLSSENLLRRAVPVLIVIFLTVVAMARWTQLDSQANSIRNSAETEITYISELLADRIGALPTKGADAASIQEIQNLVSDVVPSRYLRDGREVIVTNVKGDVIATAPYQPNMHGLSLERVLGDVLLLTTFGRRADVRDIELPDGSMALASHRAAGGAARRRDADPADRENLRALA